MCLAVTYDVQGLCAFIQHLQLRRFLLLGFWGWQGIFCQVLQIHRMSQTAFSQIHTGGYWKTAFERRHHVFFFARAGPLHTQHTLLALPQAAALPGEPLVSLCPADSLHLIDCNIPRCTSMYKFSTVVQPPGIAISELALQYWVDVVINLSDKTGAVTGVRTSVVLHNTSKLRCSGCF